MNDVEVSTPAVDEGESEAPILVTGHAFYLQHIIVGYDA